mmetsp:Transcript_59349/g.139815  ORF Transcript_59349/g.139815 Transcript_59349/m.139815 type:complete len:244 (-) Transcript_59349:223-954(-)
MVTALWYSSLSCCVRSGPRTDVRGLTSLWRIQGWRMYSMLSGCSSGLSMNGISKPENGPPTAMYRVHASRSDICQTLPPCRFSMGVALVIRAFSSRSTRNSSALLMTRSSGSLFNRLAMRSRKFSHSACRFSCRDRMRRSRSSSTRWKICIAFSFFTRSSFSFLFVSERSESAFRSLASLSIASRWLSMSSSCPPGDFVCPIGRFMSNPGMDAKLALEANRARPAPLACVGEDDSLCLLLGSL